MFQLEEGERRVPVCVKGAATQLEEVRRDLQITPSICYNRIMLLFGHDVGRYYQRAVTITDAEELGGTMLQSLSALFDEKRKGGARKTRLHG